MPYLRVMAGELTYNRALEVTISRAESHDFHWMELFVQVDFPELLPQFDSVLSARDSANEILGAHKAAYKLGDIDGWRYIEPLKKALRAIESAAAEFNRDLIRTIRAE
jgi:hypothetical protein